MDRSVPYQNQGLVESRAFFESPSGANEHEICCLAAAWRLSEHIERVGNQSPAFAAGQVLTERDCASSHSLKLTNCL
jgi:hypothetical protein